MPSKNTTLDLHKTLAHEIKAAKKAMFKRHREGMPLREAADKFTVDVAEKFGRVIGSSSVETGIKARTRQLTDFQLESIAETICRCGDDPTPKAEALLVLADEIERADVAAIRNAGDLLKRMAFIHMVNYSPEVMNAQVQMLRDELPC